MKITFKKEPKMKNLFAIAISTAAAATLIAIAANHLSPMFTSVQILANIAK